MAKLICFWMDSEHFHLLNDDKARKEAFNAIEILYLKVTYDEFLPVSDLLKSPRPDSRDSSCD